MNAAQGELIPREPTKVVTINEAGSLMEVISRAASDPAVDVDKLERLMGLYERIKAGNAAAEFSAAMADMQNELPEVVEHGKIKVNSDVRSTYATFEDINDACKPILKKHGFAMSFRTAIDEGKITVTGVLSHRGGHREETSIVLPSDVSGAKNSVQAIGSSVSYGKRYTMSALLNITTRGEDDDGHKGGTAFIDEKQAIILRDWLSQSRRTEASICKWQGIETLEELPAKSYVKVLEALKAAAKDKP